VLDTLIACLNDSPHIHDHENLARAIYYREGLMSTGIGLGVAVPHVRLESVSKITAAAAACPRGIADYESLDQEPVQLIFMVVAPAGQHAQHLKLLAALSTRFKETSLRGKLIHAPTPEAFYQILTAKTEAS
jgi:PTS system nitrogen regulatory IIA component